MGCDIHLYVESHYSKDEPWEFMIHEDAAYGDRNYELFGVLANTRNRFGITPISEPRGLPKDMSHYLLAESNANYEHSGSWLLLSEVNAYRWDQERNMSGMVSPEAMEQWQSSKSLRPPEWCQSTTAENYTKCLIPFNLKEWCSEFLEWKDSLMKYGLKYRDAEMVRLVFWFDS